MPPGPPDAWDWEEARTRCLRETRAVLGWTAAAEDAAQEALLRAWLKRASCRDAARPLPWCARIARNEALRLRAQETARREARQQAEELAARVVSPDAADQAVRRVDAGRIVAALPPLDRELVRLHYFEDLTQAEAATRVGIPWVTAKVRLHRLRERLREELERPS
ncbi:MAG: hypothetical protein QOH58_3057 [Thermoleophilaceae bacterium]|jgi:RNA polymerase sigma-70 factor (ECF subfamily)|nr:hypothetical protein [Thermoleophilaceae bacterium]